MNRIRQIGCAFLLYMICPVVNSQAELQMTPLETIFGQDQKPSKDQILFIMTRCAGLSRVLFALTASEPDSDFSKQMLQWNTDFSKTAYLMLQGINVSKNIRTTEKHMEVLLDDISKIASHYNENMEDGYRKNGSRNTELAMADLSFCRSIHEAIPISKI